MTPSPLSRLTDAQSTRRQLLAMATVGGVGAAGVATAQPARAAGSGKPDHVLTVLGTTDLHGNVFNWDYFKDAEYDDTAHNDIGVAKVGQRSIRMLRDELGAAQHADPRRRRHDPGHAAGVLLRQDRADHRAARVHPMAAGDERRSATTPRPSATTSSTTASRCCASSSHSCDFPLLGANAVDSEQRRARSSRRTSSRRSSSHGAPPIRVGILGLTNPGIAIWDKANVEGKMSSPASSSRPRSSCRGSWRPGRRRRDRLRALGRRHVVVLRRRPAATPRTPRTLSPSRCRASTPSSSVTPTSRSPQRTVTNEQPPASRSCSPSRSTGACGVARLDFDRSAKGRPLDGRRTSAWPHAAATPTPSPRTRRSPALVEAAARPRCVAYVNQRRRHLDARRCRRRRPATRTRRSWTSSTTSRPTR